MNETRLRSSEHVRFGVILSTILRLNGRVKIGYCVAWIEANEVRQVSVSIVWLVHIDLPFYMFSPSAKPSLRSIRLTLELAPRANMYALVHLGLLLFHF